MCNLPFSVNTVLSFQEVVAHSIQHYIPPELFDFTTKTEKQEEIFYKRYIYKWFKLSAKEINATNFNFSVCLVNRNF